MTRRDFVILLSLAVIVLGFVAYEIAGLTLPGWHTVSFLASQNPALHVGITVAFVVAGLVGAAWFWWHARKGRIPK